MTEKALILENISKDFSGVRVLKAVSFYLDTGEVLALVGENGAGKSTLMKIASGVYPAGSYSGNIIIDGEKQNFRSIKDAEKKGLSIIHQELNLIPELTVYENIFLGREILKKGFLDKDEMRRQANTLLSSFEIDLAPDVKISALTIGQMQMVEIAKALSKETKILIMDEPTSALTDREVGHLFLLIERLKNSGVSIIYISHRLEEVFKISDRICVLRDGAVAGGVPAKTAKVNEVITLMVGREIKDMYPPRNVSLKDPVMALNNYSVFSKQNKLLLDNINLDLKQGEIFGLAGLMGSGRSLLLMTLFGATGLKVKGGITIRNKEYIPENIFSAIESGLALVPEDRKIMGLALGMSVKHNLSLAALPGFSKFGFINKEEETGLYDKYRSYLGIKCSDSSLPVNSLSGGNQQKVVLGKWLSIKPGIVLLDEPTRGVDVGAKFEIYTILNELIKNNISVIFASSDLPEILGIAHRIGVMAGGRLAKILDGKSATQEEIMYYATGGV